MRLDAQEALRYLGAQNARGEARRAVEETAAALEEQITPRYMYRVFRVSLVPEGAYLPEAGLLLPGRLVAEMLKDCPQAALFACTLGAEFDRLLRYAQARDMAKAAVLDACGSAYVENACQEAEGEIRARFPALFGTDRFSPGYGDFPLTVQPAFLAALNAEKRLGIYALPSCLMSPGKSVTAVMGLSPRPQPAKIRGCAFCAMKNDCDYRKRGMTCAD